MIVLILILMYTCLGQQLPHKKLFSLKQIVYSCVLKRLVVSSLALFSLFIRGVEHNIIIFSFQMGALFVKLYLFRRKGGGGATSRFLLLLYMWSRHLVSFFPVQKRFNIVFIFVFRWGAIWPFLRGREGAKYSFLLCRWWVRFRQCYSFQKKTGEGATTRFLFLPCMFGRHLVVFLFSDGGATSRVFFLLRSQGLGMPIGRFCSFQMEGVGATFRFSSALQVVRHLTVSSPPFLSFFSPSFPPFLPPSFGTYS